MKTSQEIAERLHELMVYDMIAAEVYLTQAALFRHWGYQRLAEHMQHESDHEREHTRKQLDRLLYLGIPLDLTARPALKVGTTPKECLEVGLEMELTVSRKLNELISVCFRDQEAGSRRLADELLLDTEMDHILWLEQQLLQISQVGEENYLAKQIRG